MCPRFPNKFEIANSHLSSFAPLLPALEVIVYIISLSLSPENKELIFHGEDQNKTKRHLYIVFLNKETPFFLIDRKPNFILSFFRFNFETSYFDFHSVDLFHFESKFQNPLKTWGKSGTSFILMCLLVTAMAP